MEKRSNQVRLMCLSAIMAALYVGLDFLAVSISAPFGGNLKISLSGLPVIISAVFAGPIWGALTGLVGAFTGQMITYGFTATTVLWVLPAIVRGISVGLMFRAFKKSYKPLTLIIITCVSSLLVTLFNTGAMLVEQKIYGYYSSYVAIFAGVPARVFTGIITAVIFSLMLPTIIDSVKKVISIS